ncbi:MAG: peptidoglycan DD-metalloendopeptidase family protein [Pseudomonadota bacterium]|nr:peptidoglycan DD-metalloendopeptidase family protein [Pseudomonadota bacterium]
MKKILLSIIVALSLVSCSHQDADIYSYAPVDDLSTKSDFGRSYTVKKGDSLYYIAWHYGIDYKELAELNRIKSPYSLTIGQKINLLVPEKKVSSKTKDIQKKPNILSEETQSKTVKEKIKLKDNTEAKFVKSKQNLEKKYTKTTKKTPQKKNPVHVKVKSKQQKNIGKWIWPVKPDKLKKDFFKGGAQRGVDLEAPYQAKVKAAADGVVVYTGNGIKGLGNLVIIKHPHDFLTAYGYSNKVLVKEGQKIKSGQVIATVGHPPVGKDRLHFEMRKHGKSVNPMIYLPKFS